MQHPYLRGLLVAAIATVAVGSVPAGASAAAAPRLEADGYHLKWSEGATTKRGYELRITGGLRRGSERLRARGFTPAPQSGSRVRYKVRVRGSKRWSNTVRISYRRPGFLGVTANPASDGPLTPPSLAAANAKTVKQTITFKQVEPTRGNRNWADYDRELAALRRAGFNVMIQLDGYAAEPDWAKGRPSAFRSFVAAAAKRYGPGTAADVTWFEPMNEPYYVEHAYGGRVDIRRFASDWVRTVKTGRKSAPDARFLFPAEAQIYDGRTKRFEDWITASRRYQRSLARYVDGVALHPYTSGLAPTVKASKSVSAQRAFGRIDDVHASARRAGIRKPFFITELGWASHTAGEKVDQNHPPVSEADQARYLRETTAMMQKRRWMSGLYFYSWRDYGTAGQGELSSRFMGLTHTDYSPKPAYDWFVSEIRRRGNK